MSLGLYLLLIFTVFVSSSIQSSTPKREYVIKKDAVSGLKAGQFSIYSDAGEKNLTYRIESHYNPMQKIDLITYPHKTVVGKLTARQLGVYYEANYEILDTRNVSNKWFLGHIKRLNKWFRDQYTISLAERTITMNRKAFSVTFKFLNEVGKLLATSKKVIFHRSGSNKYYLKIYSNEFPDSVYILAVAANDHKETKTFVGAHARDSRE